jgi:hypothetical protein
MTVGATDVASVDGRRQWTHDTPIRRGGDEPGDCLRIQGRHGCGVGMRRRTRVIESVRTQRQQLGSAHRLRRRTCGQGARRLVWDASTMPDAQRESQWQEPVKNLEATLPVTGNIQVSLSRDERDGVHRLCVQASEDARTGDPISRPSTAGHVRRASSEGSGPAPCGGARRGAGR